MLRRNQRAILVNTIYDWICKIPDVLLVLYLLHAVEHTSEYVASVEVDVVLTRECLFNKSRLPAACLTEDVMMDRHPKSDSFLDMISSELVWIMSFWSAPVPSSVRSHP